MSPRRKIKNLRAGFVEDFNIIEVEIEFLEDGTEVSEQEGDLSLDLEDDREESEENTTQVYRFGTGVILGVFGVGLGFVSLFL
ncbi:hypothetical protein [Octadecabacter ascidiaceicola]|uniref:Uncharacterized protein n=1 Tax=Octadecabacter ascidiaceicola TaxID=1655543 RepID=A0A238JSW3_9RHOB|nr:hypothetical protein [Octadecabacter ascidiaceicola]SMX33768.1 hypothetical protein OCA8868_01017 [Octadecabacter ascidiaceicola]